MGCRTEFFFFVEKKVDHCVFRGEIYRRLPEYCNHFNIILGSQSNSKKPNFLSLFDCSPWSRNSYVMIPTTWSFPVNFTPKNYTSKWNFEKKNFRFPKGVSGSVSKSRKRPFFDIGRNFFFLLKKSWPLCFSGWNLPEITGILQSFQHYFGITVKIRKNRIFYRFFDCSPWSRNNYLMIPTTW